MLIKHQRVARFVGSVSSLIGYTIFIASCYFVAVLAVQCTLFAKKGIWLNTLCSLHNAISDSRGCDEYVANLDFSRALVTWAAVELDILVLIAGTICLLSALNALLGIVRDKLPLLPSKPSSDTATSPGL